jgi:putative DNA primase/helicase
MLMQWICWILVWIEGKNGKPGKWTKVPINPMTGARASTTDPKTWGTIDQAVAGVSRWKCDGIGFVFSAEDPYVGIDIDDCRDPQTGVITADAMAIIERCGTFTEVSQSGTGVHAIGPGVVPVGGNRQGKLELYDHGRYFVVTGHPLPGYETIVDITEPLNEVHRETFTKPERPVLPQPLNALTLDDESILKGVRNTDKGRRLYDGDFAGYQSQSEADQALCNLLCVFGADRRQADDLFRRSGLFREKWDQRRGDKTYGEKTLDKAFDGTVRRRDVTPASVRAVPVLTAFPADTPCAAQVQALQDALAVSAQRVVELEAENARLTETVSFLVQLILDPDQTQAEKIATVSFAALVEAKRDRGEVAPDGTIAVSSAEISDDWRKAPETGEATPPTNPSGSTPRMRRDKVKPTMATVAERGYVPATPRTVTRTRANGKAYDDLVWSAPATTTLLDVVKGAVMWRPSEPKVRKPRSRDMTCIHCGEVHPIVRMDYCQGCGELRNETILYPEDQAPMSANLADLKGDSPPSRSVAPSMSANLADIDLQEPDWLRDAPDDSTAAKWARGQPLQGFESTSLDPWTDVAIGARP